MHEIIYSIITISPGNDGALEENENRKNISTMDTVYQSFYICNIFRDFKFFQIFRIDKEYS